ncbi:MAG TPA: GDSL-type esterase/lipase family protein [Verrucomicrobiae bacterium]|nr:GDSL-type esterase/lipase family protein [Verrucomicrobiae bacterium]
MRDLPKTIFVCLLLFAPGQFARGADTNSHDFAKWENDIAAFEKADRTNPPPKHAILFAGSSTIRLWTTLASDFPNYRVINRGFGGSEIVDSTHFADRIIFPCEPRMIILRAGGNDLWAGKSAEQVADDYREFAAKMHAKLPETVIAFMAWNATPSRWKQADKEKKLNTLVEEFSKGQPYLRYIDAYSVSIGPDGLPRRELFRQDQLHFNADGYKLLAERVRPFLPKD